MVDIVRSLAEHTPKKESPEDWARRSSVSLLLDGPHLPDASVLMIQRAEYEGDPWSGHMAFPGGRMEPSDPTGIDAALRETHEEVGVDVMAMGDHIGRLSDVPVFNGQDARSMYVSPYVFLLPSRPPLQPNYEVADTVWLPLGFFADDANRDTMTISHRGDDHRMPCYRFDEKVIWGLSLRIINELIRVVA